MASVENNETIKSLIRSKVSYLETMAEAGIKHQLESLGVLQLLATSLSVMKFQPVWAFCDSFSYLGLIEREAFAAVCLGSAQEDWRSKRLDFEYFDHKV